MDGIWIRRCPQCGNYIKKLDPQDAGICRICGWKEKKAAAFPRDPMLLIWRFLL